MSSMVSNIEHQRPIELTKEFSGTSASNLNFIPQRQANTCPQNFKIASKLSNEFVNKVRNSKPNYNLEELDTNPPTKVSTGCH